MYFSRLKDLREDKDLNQTQLANLLFMKQQQYSRYETGKIEIPLNILISLADFYNVSLDYLTGRTDKKYVLK